ncbi:MAG TPA: hypothetical protein VEY91_08800 [Candidatus Limnocylindria bacterium]|nr:hypothetical protein [Candidatus Limnocylindria bacterium]
MPSQKLVRCAIQRGEGEGNGSARYIPLEIFDLWEHLMSSRHGFTVRHSRASLWLDMEDSPEAAYEEGQYDRVTEVTLFVYSGRDDMFTRVCRYFPSGECEHVKKILLHHYRDRGTRVQPQVRERPGIFIHRDPMADRPA